MRYINRSEERRVWPTIQKPDGTTLELEPGETADVDLPNGFEDAHLQPAPKESFVSSAGVVITVQNLSTVVSDADAQALVQVLHKQATVMYNGSCWVTEGLAAPASRVELVGKGDPIPPDTWHIELLDTSDQEGALGYHEDEAFDNKIEGRQPEAGEQVVSEKPRKASEHSSRGLRSDAPEIPLAKVFCKTTLEAGEPVSEVASHEMLEMLVDPQVVKGMRTVEYEGRIYAVEVSDPVQQSGYRIDGVAVANFVLPAYFGYPQKLNPTQYDADWVLAAPAPAMTGNGYLSFTPVNEPDHWTQLFGTSQTSEETHK